MRASIIIAAHQEGDRLWRTVQSCVETTAGLDREIIVADDASDDGSLDEVSRRWPHVRIARHDSRKGASPAKAYGARQACGEVLVFLDGHVKPEIGAVQRLIEGVEIFEGKAVITPAIAALDCEKWRNDANQIGHGYSLNLADFSCDWLALDRLRPVRKGGRQFYESPALIGCALAVSRQLYGALWGFDADMRFWGVEDLDFGLKCWLMGFSILHDPDAVIGHRFRATFDNFSAPIEHIIANQRRMARKNFMRSTEAEWIDRCRQRYAVPLSDHPVGLFAYAHELFLANQVSAEEERAYLLGHRVYDEFWYAERNGLDWPRLAGMTAQPVARAFADPSPSPTPCRLTGINPTSPKVCAGTTVRFLATGTGLSAVEWKSNGGTRPSGKGSSFSTRFDTPGTYTVTANCSGTTKTATVTVISVTFAPNPVTTGFTKTLPTNVCNVTNPTIAVTVTATVTPASAVNDVTIAIGGANRATIDNLMIDEGEGTITFSTTGKSMTPVTKPNGDMFFQAKVGGKVCAQVPVIVIVPFALRPVSAGPNRVAGVNQAASSCSTPTFYNRKPAINYVILWTYWVIDVDVPVLDQFGAILDDIYDGPPVFEGTGGSWRPIMQNVNAGTYSDPVGSLQTRPPPPSNSPNFQPNDPIAVAWPNAAKLAMPDATYTQNIGVMVAGFTMSPGVVNRIVISTPDAPGATTGTIEVDW